MYSFLATWAVGVALHESVSRLYPFLINKQSAFYLLHIYNSSHLVYPLHKNTTSQFTSIMTPSSALFTLTDASQQQFAPGNGYLALANKAHQLDRLLHFRSMEVLLSVLASSVLIFLDTPMPSVI